MPTGPIVVVAVLLIVAPSQLGRGQGAPNQPPKPNVCRCVPPIAAQASGNGACTRTQDNGTFCQLNFVSPAVGAGLGTLPVGNARVGTIVKSQGFVPALARLQSGRVTGSSIPEAAESVRAAAAAAAIEAAETKSADGNAQRFDDILAATDPGKIEAGVAEGLKEFVRPVDSSAAKPVVFTMTMGPRRYELSATPGCIAFGQQAFVFNVRAVAGAASCTGNR